MSAPDTAAERADLDLCKQRMPQRTRVSQPLVNALELRDTAFIFLGRVVTFVEVLELITALAEAIEHGEA